MAVKHYDTVTVGGVDVCEALGCVIELDGFEMDPPEPVESWVEVPGRVDGPIDMSEALTGYPTFKNRIMTVSFLAKADGRRAGEALLSRAMGMFHNRRFPITLGWDPGYTYEGRVKVEQLMRNRQVVGFKLTATCEPYKLLEHVVVVEDCAGGRELSLECGDAPAVPTWTVPSETSVNIGSLAVLLQAGTWRLPDLVLSAGENRVYVDSSGAGGEKRLISECSSDAMSAWTARPISEWVWKTKPEGGPVRVEYDWKDL